MLFEISLHTCQPAVYQALTSPVTAGSGVIATVGSTYAMYPGALLVVEIPGAALIEVVAVIAVVNATQFTANFVNSHASGVAVWGATFPTQQATDPIFTQAEMLGYLSRAQNEFLTAVPAYYELFDQTVTANIIYQNLPTNAITVERVAASPIAIPITSMVRSGNVVTLTAVQQTNLVQYNTLAVVGAADESFDGVFEVSTSPSADVITYQQIGSNASTTGGTIQQMLRLYELTQEELTQQNRNWQANSTPTLQSWFEDRAGLYRWGVGGRPGSTFPVELLCAIRDTDTLGMLDGFLVPDLCISYVKYLTLNFCWTKDGVAADAQRAEFALKRYAQGVMATQRYIAHMKMGASR